MDDRLANEAFEQFVRQQTDDYLRDNMAFLYRQYEELQRSMIGIRRTYEGYKAELARREANKLLQQQGEAQP